MNAHTKVADITPLYAKSISLLSKYLSNNKFKATQPMYNKSSFESTFTRCLMNSTIKNANAGTNKPAPKPNQIESFLNIESPLI